MFKMNFPKRDLAKYKAVQKDIMQNLDRYENDMRPQVDLSNKEINFGEFSFMEPISRTITLKNLGKSPIYWHLINAEDFAIDRKPMTFNCNWLTIEPPSGRLQKNGDMQKLTFTLKVGQESASKFNMKKIEINNVILVLRCREGPDHYITLDGKYQHSSFGTNVDRVDL